jgi:hypothetical protein
MTRFRCFGRDETGKRARVNEKRVRTPAGRWTSCGEYEAYSPHAMRRMTPTAETTDRRYGRWDQRLAILTEC